MGPFKKSSNVTRMVGPPNAARQINTAVTLPSAVHQINTAVTLPTAVNQPIPESSPSGVWQWFFPFQMSSPRRGISGWKWWIPVGFGMRRLGQRGTPPPKPYVAEHLLIKAKMVPPECHESPPAGSFVFRTENTGKERPGSQMQQRAARSGAMWW